MKLLKQLIILFLLLSSITFAQSKQLFAEIGDLKLESGESLYDCNIGFRTFGTMNADRSNIVIYPTWFGGTTSQIANLIGPGKLIDDTKYYVIAIDALGNGVSTSPSNSELQSGKDFPEISIDDMVNSQYRLLTEYLEIEHIFAIIGGSMGSMQALQWIVTYPDFIDKAIPYVASPRRSSYDQLIMAFRKKMIESYQELGADDKFIITMMNYTTQLFAYSPEYRIDNTTPEEFPAYIEKIESREPSKTFTIENHLAQLQAMITFNIYKDFNNSVNETAKHIKTEIFFILGDTDMLVNPEPALELADELGCKVLLLENNCGHLSVGCDLKEISKDIDYFLQSNIPNCNLDKYELYGSMLHVPFSKFPELIKSIDEINAEFNSLLDSTHFTKTIHVKMIVDTSGNVKCADILRGENNFVDSIAIKFVRELKLRPAERRFYPNSNVGGTVHKYKPTRVRNRAVRKAYYKKVMANVTIPLTPTKPHKKSSN